MTNLENNGEAAIEVTDLSKRFGRIVAVDRVSFRLERGAVVGLLGGNGAGKTTTIAMLLGLIEPSGGSIRILGADATRSRRQALAQMNFESPYVDMPLRITVRQNLIVYGMLYGVDDLAGRIARLAGELGLEDLLERATGTLSAGQKTRVSLAKALINSPRVLLLDEPTASLDPDTAEWVRGHLLDYCADTGAAMLLASHNMREVERMCDNVLMMKTGRIVESGTPGQLLARYGRQHLEDVFLDIARERVRR